MREKQTGPDPIGATSASTPDLSLKELSGSHLTAPAPAEDDREGVEAGMGGALNAGGRILSCQKVRALGASVSARARVSIVVQW